MKVTDASEIRRVDVAGPTESKKTQGGASKSVASDKVSTESSTQVAAASEAARSVLTQNHGLRLEAIEAAVRQGTFRPDPQRIAQKILDEAELNAMLKTMLNRQ